MDRYFNQLRSEVFRRLFDESVPRIKTCLDMLPESEVWVRSGPVLNSVGSLIHHVCGNARQYICSGIGGQEDHRNRDLEFSDELSTPKVALKEMLDQLEKDIRGVLGDMQKEALLQVRRVQCFDETGLSILIHVTEHFSYHTGQIVLLTKWMTGRETGFYGDLPLNETT